MARLAEWEGTLTLAGLCQVCIQVPLFPSKTNWLSSGTVRTFSRLSTLSYRMGTIPLFRIVVTCVVSQHALVSLKYASI